MVVITVFSTCTYNTFFVCVFIVLFTSKFSVKAAQAYSKRLKRWEGITIIHGEHVFSNFTKLQNYLIMVHWSWLWWSGCSHSRLCSGNQLKILNRCNSDSSPKIQTPTLQLFMPSWGLVFENQGPHFSIIIIMDLRKSCTTKFNWVVKRLWEGDAPKWVLKRARKKLLLSRYSATSLKCWGWNWVHAAMHPSWATGSKHI